MVKYDEPVDKPFFEGRGKGLSGITFPETRSSILREAALGNWSRFFADYLAPCWREVVLASRARGIPLLNADDLFQELIVRILRDGKFNPGMQKMLRECGESNDFRGNLPARYLKQHDLLLGSTRFRTYLKGVIAKLILESMRGQRRELSLDRSTLARFEPRVEESVDQSLERNWISNCLCEAAAELLNESLQAQTKGRRRVFDVLWLSSVKALSSKEIAKLYEVDRSTISELLTLSRLRFLQLLQESTGIDDLVELRNTVLQTPELLRDALLLIRGLDEDVSPSETKPSGESP